MCIPVEVLAHLGQGEMEGQQRGWAVVVPGETEVIVELWDSIPLLNISAGNIVLWLILFYLQCSVASLTDFFLLQNLCQ